MEKNQVDERSHTTTDTESKQNPNEGSNGNKNSMNQPESKKDGQDTETPGIGDDQPKESDEITMGGKDDEDADSDENQDSEQNKEEAVEEQPLNGKPDERKIGDSDAQAVVNGTENQVVNK